MKWLINYIRQCFCKHAFDFEEEECKVKYGGEDFKHGIRISMLCKKCGYHKSVWKY